MLLPFCYLSTVYEYNTPYVFIYIIIIYRNKCAGVCGNWLIKKYSYMCMRCATLSYKNPSALGFFYIFIFWRKKNTHLKNKLRDVDLPLAIIIYLILKMCCRGGTKMLYAPFSFFFIHNTVPCNNMHISHKTK